MNEKPGLALFSPFQVGAATFLGNAMAGGALLAINYARLNKKKQAMIAFFSCVGVAAAMFGLSLVLPHSLTNGMYIGQAVGFRFAAKALQEADYKLNIEQGGRRASNWAMFGIGIAGLLVTVGVLLLLFFTIPDVFMPNVQVAANEKVYYQEQATKEDATKCGEALKRIGFFNGKRESTVTISKTSSGVTVSIPVSNDAWEQEDIVAAFKEIGEEIAPSIDAHPMKLELTDTWGNSKKTINIE